jgi:AcrR family transcriptional regulator
MLKKILDAAEREFGEKGLDGTKILSIAQLAGTSKQLIYHYFESKERLYEIIVRDMTFCSFNTILLMDIADENPVESIRKFFLSYLNHLERNPELIVISVDQGLHRGAQLRVDRELTKVRDLVLAKLEAPLIQGQHLGLLKSALDVHRIFFLINALVVGSLSLRALFSMHDGPVSKTSREDWLHLMGEFFLDAIRA